MTQQINNVYQLNVRDVEWANISGTQYITPDAMLVYCQSRMRNLDEQIQAQFSKQRENAADQMSLKELKQWFSDYAHGGIGKDAVQRKQDAMSAIQYAMSKITDKDTLAKLNELYTKMDKLKQGGGELKAEEVKAQYQDVIDSLTGRLNQGSELGMITLQSIMSQRQTAVQLTTNLIQALGDQMKQIAGNIGK